MARYELDGGWVPAVALLGPEGADAPLVARARERAAPWLLRRESGVVRLLAVEGIDRRTAWIYEDDGSVSVDAILARFGILPQRLGPALVAAVADVIEPLAADGWFHPGFTAADILLGADGSVKVAGWVGPFGQIPAHREPRGAEDAAAAVWRLGILLAEILTGQPPVPGTDRGGHELALRRLYVKVMSRPGPMFPDRYRDWLGAMLSWDAAERPLLSRIGPGLRELAASLPGPDLRDFATSIVAEVKVSAATDAAPVLEAPADFQDPSTPAPVERTEEAHPSTFSDHPEHDDVTAVSFDGDPPLRIPPLPEPGTIPVHVGPPPEGVPRQAHLPPELFAVPSIAPELTDTTRGRRAWYAVAALAALAAALTWYLWS